TPGGPPPRRGPRRPAAPGTTPHRRARTGRVAGAAWRGVAGWNLHGQLRVSSCALSLCVVRAAGGGPTGGGVMHPSRRATSFVMRSITMCCTSGRGETQRVRLHRLLGERVHTLRTGHLRGSHLAECRCVTVRLRVALQWAATAESPPGSASRSSCVVPSDTPPPYCSPAPPTRY